MAFAWDRRLNFSPNHVRYVKKGLSLVQAADNFDLMKPNIDGTVHVFVSWRLGTALAGGVNERLNAYIGSGEDPGDITLGGEWIGLYFSSPLLSAFAVNATFGTQGDCVATMSLMNVSTISTTRMPGRHTFGLRYNRDTEPTAGTLAVVQVDFLRY